MSCEHCKLEPTFYDVALDFDGVVHRYSLGLHDGSIYDPVMGGFAGVYRIMKERDVSMVIYSCREPTSIIKWLDENGFDIPVTRTKPLAAVYVDDKGYRFTHWSENELDNILSKIKTERFMKTQYGQSHVG